MKKAKRDGRSPRGLRPRRRSPRRRSPIRLRTIFFFLL